jgi:hypothetical protein
VRAENADLMAAGWRIAAFGLLALLAAIVLGWTAFLLPASLAALGGLYGLQLLVDDWSLDLAAPLVAVALIVIAELAYWSLEEREQVEEEPAAAFRRLAFLALLALGTFLGAAALLALVDAVRTVGLAVDLLGAAAAAAVLLAIVLSARRRS